MTRNCVLHNPINFKTQTTLIARGYKLTHHLTQLQKHGHMTIDIDGRRMEDTMMMGVAWRLQ